MKVVQLRCYSGDKLSYNADGGIQNVNQLVKLKHDIIEWHNYLKTIKTTGFCQIEVEKVFDITDKKNPKEIKDITPYINEVNKAFNRTAEKPLTNDQKRIQELEAKLDLIINGKAAPKEKETEKFNHIPTLNAADTIARLKECNSVEEIDAIIEGEERKGVLSAADELKKAL